jgi:hypothetical protein
VTGIDLDRLEALAKAARPGPWVSPAPGRVGTPDGKRTEIGIVRRTADANYIAAADPQTVLQLVEQVRNWHAYLRWRGEQDKGEDP